MIESAHATVLAQTGGMLQFLGRLFKLVIVYKRQNFLKVVVLLITNGQCDRITFIYSRGILVAVTSECSVKPGLAYFG